MQSHTDNLLDVCTKDSCSAVCRHAVVKCSSVVEAAAAEGSKELFSSSGNSNLSQKYVGKGKIVHRPSCSGEDYKSSWSAGGCLEIHHLKLLAGSSALSLQVHGSSSLLFMMKVMVCDFVSDSHEVMTALIVMLPLIVVVEISLQLHQSFFAGS